MVIPRPRLKQPHSVEQRLKDEAPRLHEQTELLPLGPVRVAALRQTQQCVGAQFERDWSCTPGLQSAK